MSIEYDATHNTFYETEPILSGKNVFVYIKFPSLERAEYGVYLTDGGAKGNEIASENVEETTYDPTTIAPLTDFNDAVNVLKDGDSLEEFPYVEVSDEAQFNKLVEAAGKNRENEQYTGPGVYIISGSAYTKQYESVDSYQADEMKITAESLVDDIFSSGELEEAANLLLVKNNMEVED